MKQKGPQKYKKECKNKNNELAGKRNKKGGKKREKRRRKGGGLSTSEEEYSDSAFPVKTPENLKVYNFPYSNQITELKNIEI